MAVAPTLTKSELAERILELTEDSLSKRQVNDVLDALIYVTEDAISNVERVRVAGVVIGPVLRPARKARKGRNPATGESIDIPKKPASVAVKASISKPLKEAVPSAQKARRVLK